LSTIKRVFKLESRSLPKIYRYESGLFPNTTVEHFDDIEEIMRTLVDIPVSLSGLEYILRSMRDTLRYVESA